MISYKDGEFQGSFTVAVSRTLSEFATFDRRTKSWKAHPSDVPVDIKAAGVVAAGKVEDIQRQIVEFADFLEKNLNDTIQTLSLPIVRPILEMEGQIKTDLSAVAVSPDLPPERVEQIAQEYNENQTTTIKGWTVEQTSRLRDMVERNVFNGSRRNDLEDMIRYEWDVTQNKAKFWARQETSLLLSKYSELRFKDAGIRRYRWSTSHDERVRESHKELNGQVFFFDSPPIVDQKTGRRAHPGEDFNCRCVKIPIID
jgi:SPP1 gp7 family putative phage head morphogenesis protein